MFAVVYKIIVLLHLFTRLLVIFAVVFEIIVMLVTCLTIASSVYTLKLHHSGPDRRASYHLRLSAIKLARFVRHDVTHITVPHVSQKTIVTPMSEDMNESEKSPVTDKVTTDQRSQTEDRLNISNLVQCKDKQVLLLSSMFNLMKQYDKNMMGRQDDQKIVNEWKEISAIFDMFLFCVTFLVIIIIAPITLVAAPMLARGPDF